MSPSPLVFIPDLKGSRLVGAQGRTRWCTGTQALGFSGQGLALPVKVSGHKQEGDDLRAAGPLERVTVIPGILGETVYGPWLQMCRSRELFTALSYDWRRDNFESLEQIESRLSEIFEKNGNTPLNVVAHSMGGMLVVAILKRRPELFHKIVFAGVPFHGGVGFLPDMHIGLPTGINRRILSPRVLFTFPSIYSFFSETREVTVDSTARTVSLNYYDAENWKKHHLGVFSQGAVSKTEENFLTWALNRGREFRRLMDFSQIPKLPPMMVVVGRNFPTVDKVMLNGPRAVRGLDFQSCPHRPGDGRVHGDNLPPPTVPFELVVSQKDHANLLNEAAVQKKIWDFLN